jgi:hypothetical protein
MLFSFNIIELPYKKYTMSMLLISCIFMLIFFIRYKARKHLVDVTEIFRQLNGEKKYRMIKLAFYFCLFIITIYRFDVWILWLANSL